MERRHRLRAVRTLIAAALLLAVFWWLYSCPLPTREMRLRRSERQLLVGESDIVFSYESGIRVERGSLVMLVSVGERTVQTCSDYGDTRVNHRLEVWPKNPAGATLVALYGEIEGLTAGLVAVEPPASAERAVLTIYWPFDIWFDGEEVVVTAEGERKGEVFLFWMETTEDVPYNKILRLSRTTRVSDLPPYTLEFFSGDGALLETVTNMA